MSTYEFVSTILHAATLVGVLVIIGFIGFGAAWSVETVLRDLGETKQSLREIEGLLRMYLAAEVRRQRELQDKNEFRNSDSENDNTTSSPC